MRRLFSETDSGHREYFGELKSSVVPKEHGIGTYLVNADIAPMLYLGEFVNGEMAGIGIKKWSQVRQREPYDDANPPQDPYCQKYVGTFEKDSRSGNGIFKWPNGAVWAGEFKDNVAHGLGIFTNPEGYRYVGYCRKEYITGNGTWYDKDWNGVNITEHGYTQKGEKVDNTHYITPIGDVVWMTAEGYGTYTDAEPRAHSYQGEFKDGKRHGHGTITYKDRSTYVGRFINGERRGWGTRQFANGNRYEGTWTFDPWKDWNNKDGSNVTDHMNGYGTFYWQDGMKHTGQFRHGKPNGYGKRTYTNGEIAHGHWKDGEIVYGIYEWPFPFRKKYEGEFKNGLQHGHGTLYAMDHSQLAVWDYVDEENGETANMTGEWSEGNWVG